MHKETREEMHKETREEMREEMRKEMPDARTYKSNVHETSPVALLRKLVQIPSPSRSEGPVADALQAFLDENGLEVHRIGDNVIASIGKGPHTLLLNSHLDTVPPAEDHPHGPFSATMQDGYIYGRGTVDAKASVAAMACALASLAGIGYAPEDGRILAAFTVCEETGGADNGLEEVLSQLGDVHSALVGEPTHMQPCIAQKGLLILKMKSVGKAAHAARPSGGLNAIAQAARDVITLQNLNFDRVHPGLGPVTLEATTIEGGIARNVIPDRCITYLDIRTTPAYTHGELAGIIQNAVDSAIEVHSERFVPVQTDPEHAIVQACLEANPGSATFGSPTMSDWIFLKKIPAVKIGPGESSLSHTAGERIAADELERACTIFRDIILSYFQKINIDRNEYRGDPTTHLV